MAQLLFTQTEVFTGNSSQIKPWFTDLEKYCKIHPWMISSSKQQEGFLINEPVPFLGFKIPNSYLIKVAESKDQLIWRAKVPIAEIELSFRFEDLKTKTRVVERTVVTGLPGPIHFMMLMVKKTHRKSFQNLKEVLNNG